MNSSVFVALFCLSLMQTPSGRSESSQNEDVWHSSFTTASNRAHAAYRLLDGQNFSNLEDVFRMLGEPENVDRLEAAPTSVAMHCYSLLYSCGESCRINVFLDQIDVDRYQLVDVSYTYDGKKSNDPANYITVSIIEDDRTNTTFYDHHSVRAELNDFREPSGRMGATKRKDEAAGVKIRLR